MALLFQLFDCSKYHVIHTAASNKKPLDSSVVMLQTYMERRSWGRKREPRMIWGAIREFDLWSVEALVAAERITAEVTVGRLLIADSNVFSHVIVESFPRPGRSGSQMNEQDRVVSLRLFAQLNDHQLLIKKTTQLFVRIRKRRIGELVLTKETFHQFNGSLRFPVQRRLGDPTGDRRNGLKTSQRRSRVEQ